MKYDFFFWWSVVSTSISIILLAFSIWQYWVGRSKNEKSQAQTKVWMQDANGISEGLRRIVVDNLGGRYSSTNDVCNAIWSVHASANALYQSLYEERCVTEEEYRARQKKLSELLDAQQFDQLKAKPPEGKG